MLKVKVVTAIQYGPDEEIMAVERTLEMSTEPKGGQRIRAYDGAEIRAQVVGEAEYDVATGAYNVLAFAALKGRGKREVLKIAGREGWDVVPEAEDAGR